MTSATAFPYIILTLGALCCFPFLEAQIEAQVTLSGLDQIYTGAPRIATALTRPAGLPTQLTYRDLRANAPAPTIDVVYDDTPPVLNLSYFSNGFSAGRLSSVANYLQLGGSSRQLDSCDVILVTWAKANDWPVLKAANPAGYQHPITISIYELSPTDELVLRTEVTESIFIPWRPLTQSNGQPYPFNGFAFRATVSFKNGITLPERAAVALSYNTQLSGRTPIGVNGPYNSLNVGYVSAANPALVGRDLNPDSYFQFSNGTWGIVQGVTNASIPMIRLKASSSVSITPPTQAGSWQVTAAISNASYSGSDTKTLTVRPAPASIRLDRLVQVPQGRPQPVLVTTDPPNLATRTSYPGLDPSITLPSALGRYAVFSEITDPNYIGSATGELWLGENLQSWLAPWLDRGVLSTKLAGDLDDPDQDGLPNLLEYAYGFDPTVADGAASPHAEFSDGKLSLVYSRNPAATDLEFQVEACTQLGALDAWSVTPTTDVVIATAGSVQSIRATLPAVPPAASRFARIRVKRVTP